MNGFLLFACCNLDDIPVQMYATLKGAQRAAKRCRKGRIYNPLGAMDASGFICWKVLEFKNGKPKGTWTSSDEPLDPNDGEKKVA